VAADTANENPMQESLNKIHCHLAPKENEFPHMLKNPNIHHATTNYVQNAIDLYHHPKGIVHSDMRIRWELELAMERR